MLALFDSGSKVNTIHSTFAKDIGFFIRLTDIEAQKIDGTTLNIFEIVVTVFSITSKANQVRFFEKAFLLANVSPKIVLEILFLTLSSADINFLGRELRCKIYTTKKALPTIRRVELVGKKEFAVAVLDPESETFVVHVASPSFSPLNVYSFCRPQIAGLIAKKAFIKVSAKYLDFADVFFSDLVSELFKHTAINNHAIKLVDSQQPPYRPIYSLKLVELETLKAYMESNLANMFIKLFKSPASAPILFDWNSDGFFWLYVNYQGFNNLTIKNWYPLPLIGESLDRLRKAKQFS